MSLRMQLGHWRLVYALVKGGFLQSSFFTHPTKDGYQTYLRDDSTMHPHKEGLHLTPVWDP